MIDPPPTPERAVIFDDCYLIFANTSFDPAGVRFEYEPLRGNLFEVAEKL